MNTPIACLLDVSYGADPEFLARCGGKIYMSGFFDDSVDTHCCSFTPMVDVTYLGLVAEEMPEDETAREALYMDLLDAFADSEAGGYVRRADVTRLRKAHPERFVALGFSADEGTPEEQREEIREYLSGNPIHG